MQRLTSDSFLVFPFSFEPATDITTSQGALSVVALVLLALGYSLSVALWFLCTSTLFQFDVLFMYVLVPLLLLSAGLIRHSIGHASLPVSSVC